MAIVYFDSSALVKLFLDEAGSEEARELWNASDAVLSSDLAYPEVCSGLAAAGRSGRVAHRAAARAAGVWDDVWPGARKIAVSEGICHRAGSLAASRGLSGADAVHLASVLAIYEPGVIFAVWDERLRSAAVAEGVAVVPAV
jgi:uncharacterized protein